MALTSTLTRKAGALGVAAALTVGGLIAAPAAHADTIDTFSGHVQDASGKGIPNILVVLVDAVGAQSPDPAAQTAASRGLFPNTGADGSFSIALNETSNAASHPTDVGLYVLTSAGQDIPGNANGYTTGLCGPDQAYVVKNGAIATITKFATAYAGGQGIADWAAAGNNPATLATPDGQAAYKAWLASSAGQAKMIAWLQTDNGKAAVAANALPAGTAFNCTVAPRNTAKPAISGTAKVGSTLKVSSGTWGASETGGTFKYSWQRNGKTIAHASKSSYKLTAADAGTKITAKVTSTGVTHLPDYGVSSASKTVAKLKSKTALKVTKPGAGQLRISVSVKSGKTAIAGKVTLKVGSKSYSVTLKKGAASKKLKGLTPGNYKVTATFKATKAATKSTASKKVTV
ncbi:MAG TPA: hypothetical protein VGL26_10515, partial [Jatrophihabitans sp.]